MKKLFALTAALLLAACGAKVSGTYVDKQGMVSFDFGSNGKVTQTAMGMETELPYAVEDNKVKLQGPGGVMVLTLQDDGSLATPWGTMVKSK